MAARFHQRLVKPRLKPRPATLPLISKSSIRLSINCGLFADRVKLFHTSGYRDDFGEKFRRFSRCGYTTLFADGLRHSTTRDFFPSRPSRSPRGNRDSLLSGTRAEPESKINAFAPAVINRMRIVGEANISFVRNIAPLRSQGKSRILYPQKSQLESGRRREPSPIDRRLK